MGVRRIFSRWGNVKLSLVLFQVADDAVETDVHKTLSTPQRKCPMLRQRHKNALRWQQ